MKLGHKPLRSCAQPPNLSLGQEENCPQQERTHRESGTHTEWALRERKHQGVPPQTRHPGTQASGSPFPPILGSQVPSPGNEPSHTEEMEFYFHKYRVTPI